MKKTLFYFFSTLPTTLITLLISYLLLYYYTAKGLSITSSLMLLLITPILIFLITFFIGYKIFKMQLTTAYEQNIILDKRNISFLFLVISFLFNYIFFEYLYYFFLDKQISKNYSLKLFEISSDKIVDANSNEFSGLPFLMLNFFNHILLIISVFIINSKAYKHFIPKLYENKNNINI